MAKKLYPVLLLALSSLFFCGCGSSTPEQISKTGFYFDTVITATLYDTDNSDALNGCFDLADTCESYFDANKEDSDVAKINAAENNWVTVHDQTAELIRKGIEYGNLSHGGFDITIGALSSLWDFHDENAAVPDAAAIQSAVQTVDYTKIETDGNKIRLTQPGARIDLGGIAKGYIADQMKTYLHEQGVTSGIINLGGNVLCIGPKSDKSPYRIGIQKPFAEDGTPAAVVSVEDKTVVSSGIYERYFKTADGTLYHHILNPKTGYPYNNDLYGVSVICDSSTDGDGLSTTCFSLGLNDGMALIESLPDTEAIFITADGVLHTSSGIGTDIPFQESD